MRDDDTVPPNPLLDPLKIVFPYKESNKGTLGAEAITTPPIAFPPYLIAPAPFITFNVPTAFIPILGACSAPHS